jgi:hypothetical protein
MDPQVLQVGRSIHVRTLGKDKTQPEIFPDHAVNRPHQMTGQFRPYVRPDLPPGVWTLSDLMKLIFPDAVAATANQGSDRAARFVDLVGLGIVQRADTANLE